MTKALKKNLRRFFRFIYGWGVIQWFLAIVYYVLIWFVYLTSRKEINGLQTLRKYARKPAVFVFWHNGKNRTFVAIMNRKIETSEKAIVL